MKERSKILLGSISLIGSIIIVSSSVVSCSAIYSKKQIKDVEATGNLIINKINQLTKNGINAYNEYKNYKENINLDALYAYAFNTTINQAKTINKEELYDKLTPYIIYSNFKNLVYNDHRNNLQYLAFSEIEYYLYALIFSFISKNKNAFKDITYQDISVIKPTSLFDNKPFIAIYQLYGLSYNSKQPNKLACYISYYPNANSMKHANWNYNSGIWINNPISINFKK